MSGSADGMSPTAHPRPLLRRPWRSLDGTWGFHADPTAKHATPGGVSFDRTIAVPFAPESPASGVGGLGGFDRSWYQRPVRVDPPAPDEKILLHFGAVDRVAAVWVNGRPCGSHTGGYTPFSVDVTEESDAGELDVVVRADDDPLGLDFPRGKQDWEDQPHRVWYPRTSGIWRTVWLERLPSVHLADIHFSADTEAMTLAYTVRIGGRPARPVRARVKITHGQRILSDEDFAVFGDHATRIVEIGDGGIDDRLRLLWRPEQPTLLDVDAALFEGEDCRDEARSYTALRSVRVTDGRFLLNGRPTQLRLALHQGYWPATGATAPDVDALGRDLILARSLGFNGVRVHQKVEDPRLFAWADALGMMAWVEMPSAYAAGPTTAANLLNEWPGVVETYRGYPSVIAWVPINESWGVPGLESDPRQRHLLAALGHITGALDGTRPVSVNDGWETVGGDILGIHDYDQNPAVLRSRYGKADALDQYTSRRRFDGRFPDLDRQTSGPRAVVLSEFGGVAFGDESTPRSWGYDRVGTAKEFLDRYRDLWASVHESDVLAGACWTQLTDTYQEVNGVLRFDRTPKADPDLIRAATTGIERGL